MGELAVCYLCGFGVKRNLTFAIDIFQSLALREYEIPPISLAAKMALAKMYLAGEGVKKNEENTLYYLYSIKDFLPYFTASKVYRLEECLKLKDEDLFQWLNRKASEKDSRSQAILGLYYFSRKNFEQAEKWYELAADQGDLRAKAALSCMQEKKQSNKSVNSY